MKEEKAKIESLTRFVRLQLKCTEPCNKITEREVFDGTKGANTYECDHCHREIKYSMPKPRVIYRDSETGKIIKKSVALTLPRKDTVKEEVPGY